MSLLRLRVAFPIASMGTFSNLTAVDCRICASIYTHIFRILNLQFVIAVVCHGVVNHGFIWILLMVTVRRGINQYIHTYLCKCIHVCIHNNARVDMKVKVLLCEYVLSTKRVRSNS